MASKSLNTALSVLWEKGQWSVDWMLPITVHLFETTGREGVEREALVLSMMDNGLWCEGRKEDKDGKFD